MKQPRSAHLALVVALTLFFGFALAQGGKYVNVSPDLKIYYEEAGTGDPIIFIPGWTATTWYYQQQLDHFSKNYHAISYDPRSQGRSSKTPENNNFKQRGDDLKAFIDTMKLSDVVLVGHSSGCFDAHAYFRAYGTENIKAFVCIDKNPKDVWEKEGDWSWAKTATDVLGGHNSMMFDRLNVTREFVQTLYTHPLPEAELNEFVDTTMATPDSVALMLQYDATAADYTPEVRMADGEIPVLYVLADADKAWAELGKTWFAKNAPNTKVVILKGTAHNMHMEFPGRFNAAVDTFLVGIE